MFRLCSYFKIISFSFQQTELLYYYRRNLKLFWILFIILTYLHKNFPEGYQITTRKLFFTHKRREKIDLMRWWHSTSNIDETARYQKLFELEKDIRLWSSASVRWVIRDYWIIDKLWEFHCLIRADSYNWKILNRISCKINSKLLLFYYLG